MVPLRRKMLYSSILLISTTASETMSSHKVKRHGSPMHYNYKTKWKYFH